MINGVRSVILAGVQSKDNSLTVRTKDGGVVRYEGHFSSDDHAPPMPTEPLRPDDMTLQRLDNILIVVEDLYRLCFVRGPEGIVVGLAERLG